MVNGGYGWNGYYLSAYGLAVKHGFKGSEEEWLESLKLPAKEAAQIAGEKVLELETAAGNADTKAQLADTAATNANAKAQLAVAAADFANAKAQLADAATANANAKAQLADTAATNANAKAQLADAATANANTKAQLADTAATNANAKAQAAAEETTDLAQIKAAFNAWVEESKADFLTQVGLMIKLTTEDIKDGQSVSYADGTLLLVYKDALSAMSNGGASK